MFRAAWVEVDPSLAEDALAEIPKCDPRWGLAPRERSPEEEERLRSRALEEALLWIWREDIPLDDPRLQDHLRGGLVGSASPWSQARLQLEARVRLILAAIADRAYGTQVAFEATDPRSNQPFEPDPDLLHDLVGYDRSRNQIPTSSGLIRHLRFVERQLDRLLVKLQKHADQQYKQRQGKVKREPLIEYAMGLGLNYDDARDLVRKLPKELIFTRGRPRKKIEE